MIKIDGISVSLDYTKDELYEKLKKLTNAKIKNYYIYKKAVDARKKDDVHFVLSIILDVENEQKYIDKIKGAKVFDAKEFDYPHIEKKTDVRPVIIGSGPAGSFAALCLANAGAKPIIIERGKKVCDRKKDTDIFFKTGILNNESNVQFGEGGAGTFSDGKLNTGTNSLYIRKILSEYVKFGASKDILIDAKPHIGTDVLIDVAKNIRDYVEKNGGEYLFEEKVCDLEIKNGKISAVITSKGKKIETDYVVCAIGHSARDTFEMLDKRNVSMISKPFSVGVRIEHKQEFINKAQYGKMANHKNLKAADYKFGDDCYTFCMCPGGYVVAATSEEEGIVTNGMSNHLRDGENANSALLVNVDSSDFGNDLFAGVNFQRMLEKKAYEYTKSYAAPCQKLGDFFNGTKTTSFGSVLPTYSVGVMGADLTKILPCKVVSKLLSGIKNIDKKLKGFAMDDAVLTAPETRSSSPVRIVRDLESLQSVNVKGLYPCGEGAGYAGGIMSAASDGIRCACKIIEEMNKI
ncbi:MAG: hypothetical protein E7404_02095 [Ruminococcaceae bacterium]|nr:hypothetical protein [Oscillospiraceae bacterium]